MAGQRESEIKSILFLMLEITNIKFKIVRFQVAEKIENDYIDIGCTRFKMCLNELTDPLNREGIM